MLWAFHRRKSSGRFFCFRAHPLITTINSLTNLVLNQELNNRLILVHEPEHHGHQGCSAGISWEQKLFVADAHWSFGCWRQLPSEDWDGRGRSPQWRKKARLNHVSVGRTDKKEVMRTVRERCVTFYPEQAWCSLPAPCFFGAQQLQG